LFAVELPRQVTLAVIKPDAVKAGLVDEIIQKVISGMSQKSHVMTYDNFSFSLFNVLKVQIFEKTVQALPLNLQKS